MEERGEGWGNEVGVGPKKNPRPLPLGFRLPLSQYSMRLARVPPLHLGLIPISEAFERVFGEDVLRLYHGEGLSVTPWRNFVRDLKFEVKLDSIPQEIRTLLCGKQLRVSCRQSAKVETREISLRTKMRMHFVGRELFIVRPRFKLVDAGEDGIVFTQEVELHAMLPPPLCNIIEACMSLSCEDQMGKFSETVRLLNR